jgi:hypothetical protein
MTIQQPPNDETPPPADDNPQPAPTDVPDESGEPELRAPGQDQPPLGAPRDEPDPDL